MTVLSSKSRQNPAHLAWHHAQLSKIDSDSLHLNVHFSSSVCHLGFILNPILSLSDHVNSVSHSGFYCLRQLCLICQSLPLHAIPILVHALICARVDYSLYKSFFKKCI